MAKVNISFYLNTYPLPKTDKEAMRIITLYYSFTLIKGQKRRYTITTKESIQSKYWDLKKQRVKSTGTSIQATINTQLNKYEESIIDYFSTTEITDSTAKHQVEQLMSGLYPQGKLPELQKVEAPADPEPIKQISFLEWVTGFIPTAPNRQPSTKRQYGTTLTHLRIFSKTSWGNRDILFDDIDKSFIEAFEGYLTFTAKLSKNTIGSHKKNIKMFMNESADYDIHSNLKFKKGKAFRVETEDVESIALSEVELDTIYTLDLTLKPALERVRDMFVIGCYTALRYSDLHQVKMERITDDILTITATKTGGVVSVPISHVVKDILRKYNNVLPKVLSNQKFNKALHEIARLAGFNDIIETTGTKAGAINHTTLFKSDMIKSHTARRTAATNMYLLGVPTITIMSITGHKTEKQFMKYIKVTGRQHAEIARLQIDSRRKELTTV